MMTRVYQTIALMFKHPKIAHSPKILSSSLLVTGILLTTVSSVQIARLSLQSALVPKVNSNAAPFAIDAVQSVSPRSREMGERGELSTQLSVSPLSSLSSRSDVPQSKIQQVDCTIRGNLGVPRPQNPKSKI
jgi:hypothetical protein